MKLTLRKELTKESSVYRARLNNLLPCNHEYFFILFDEINFCAYHCSLHSYLKDFKFKKPNKAEGVKSFEDFISYQCLSNDYQNRLKDIHRSFVLSLRETSETMIYILKDLYKSFNEDSKTQELNKFGDFSQKLKFHVHLVLYRNQD